MVRAAARRRREERVRDRVPGVPPRVAHRDGRHLQVVSSSVREGFKDLKIFAEQSTHWL